MTTAPNFLVPKLTVEVAEDPARSLCEDVTHWLRRQPPTAVSAAHDPRWLLVMRDGLGHKPHMLIARQGNDVCGYLPLALMRSRHGLQLVSLPYVKEAGPVATHEAAGKALVDEAIRLAHTTGARLVELRMRQMLKDERLHEAQRGQGYVLPLKADGDFHWQTLSPKQRRSIRRGEQQGLGIIWGGREEVDAFYDIYAAQARHRGWVRDRELFAQLLWRFEQDAEVAIVQRGGRAIATALLLHDAMTSERTTQVHGAAMLRLFDGRDVQAWMYHRLMERAIARGSRLFDFGPMGAVPPAVWPVRGQALRRQYYLSSGAGDLPGGGRRWRVPSWVKRLLLST